MSQSIDFSAVTDATFNGATVDEIKLNGTSIWVGSTATGGIITQSGAYTIHTFNSSSSFVLNKSKTIEYLVVGGGGGSGSMGGGGGSVLTGTLSNLSSGSYSITVGYGGGGTTSWGGTGATGGTSTFSSISSAGGGGGDMYHLTPDTTAPEGDALGGTSGNGNVGFGVAYWTLGGGGGAGAISTGFRGGIGINSSISGSSVGYGGGGGGGGYNALGETLSGSTLHEGFLYGGGGFGGSVAPTSGATAVANTGGGGSPTIYDGTNLDNRSGGSGIIILRYQT